MEKQFNPFSLENKTILVTGASSGIGRQCAVDCSKMGAKVLAIGRDLKRLEGVVSEMANRGEFYQFDLTDIDGIKDLIKTVVAEHGKIDGFIHAAGVGTTSPVRFTKRDEYESLYRVNCLSACEIVKHLCGPNSFSNNGSVVFIGSISSMIARKGLSAYAASKGALVSVSRVMALELATRGIRVNTISPGTIMTPMMQKALDAMDEDQKKKRCDGFPLGLGKETDISNACIFLLSDASRWVTGSNLVIDGGYTLS